MYKRYLSICLAIIVAITAVAVMANVDIRTNDTEPMVFLEADLNRDGYVDLADFAIFAQQWLNEADPNGL